MTQGPGNTYSRDADISRHLIRKAKERETRTSPPRGVIVVNETFSVNVNGGMRSRNGWKYILPKPWPLRSRHRARRLLDTRGYVFLFFARFSHSRHAHSALATCRRCASGSAQFSAEIQLSPERSARSSRTRLRVSCSSPSLDFIPVDALLTGR